MVSVAAINFTQRGSDGEQSSKRKGKGKTEQEKEKERELERGSGLIPGFSLDPLSLSPSYVSLSLVPPRSRSGAVSVMYGCHH